VTEDLLRRPPVMRVQEALRAAGSAARVIALDASARTAVDAAAALGCPVGAIVKSLVFAIGGQPVLALVAGDRRCDIQALKSALALPGEVSRPDAEGVRAATGFTIGGVPPLGHAPAGPSPGGQSPLLPTAIDASLMRFERLFAAAGHPHCVFATDYSELVRLTGAQTIPGTNL
jgi:prolyl-tRNA editing enzyme YbaK/EbsC (Cys-tRNA(Pro) deacylase)